MNNYTKCAKQINEKNAAYDRIQFENNVTNILKGFRDHQVYDSVDVVNNRFKHQLKRKAIPLNKSCNFQKAYTPLEQQIIKEQFVGWAGAGESRLQFFKASKK